MHRRNRLASKWRALIMLARVPNLHPVLRRRRRRARSGCVMQRDDAQVARADDGAEARVVERRRRARTGPPRHLREWRRHAAGCLAARELARLQRHRSARSAPARASRHARSSRSAARHATLAEQLSRHLHRAVLALRPSLVAGCGECGDAPSADGALRKRTSLPRALLRRVLTDGHRVGVAKEMLKWSLINGTPDRNTTEFSLTVPVSQPASLVGPCSQG
eukprot:scaffold65608_cov71-Phaeocystis_antarctica.AAC.3